MSLKGIQTNEVTQKEQNVIVPVSSSVFPPLGSRDFNVYSVTELEAFEFSLCFKLSGDAVNSVCDPERFASSGTLTQAIRNFAKSLESWLTNAMTSFPQEIIRTKVTGTADPLLDCVQLKSYQMSSH